MIFRDDRDRRRLLGTLGEACEKTGWRIHAYVLMSNHYHRGPRKLSARDVRKARHARAKLETITKK